MKNITVKKYELTEYIAPEGKVFRKIEFYTSKGGEVVEMRHYISKLVGLSIDIDTYELADITEKEEYEQQIKTENHE